VKIQCFITSRSVLQQRRQRRREISTTAAATTAATVRVYKRNGKHQDRFLARAEHGAQVILRFYVSSLQGGVFGLAFGANRRDLGFDIRRGRFVIHRFLQSRFRVRGSRGASGSARTTSSGSARAATATTTTTASCSATATQSSVRCVDRRDLFRNRCPFGVIRYGKRGSVRVQQRFRIGTTAATTAAAIPTSTAATTTAPALGHQIGAPQSQRGNYADQDQCFLNVHNTLHFI
jgi:hypothetical protein